MHRTILSVSALLVVCPSGPSLSANESVKVGWSAGDGRVLFTELNCSGCHTTNSDLLPLASRQGPRLGDVGGRVTPDYLQRYLLDPHAIKPGTPMPDLLHGMPDQERRQTVEALTHFWCRWADRLPIHRQPSIPRLPRPELSCTTREAA